MWTIDKNSPTLCDPANGGFFSNRENMNLSKISIRAATKLFFAIVATLFAAVGLVAFTTVNSLIDTLEEAATNAALLRNSGEMLRAHESMRADRQAYLNAFEHHDLDRLGGIRQQHAAHAGTLNMSVQAIDKTKMAVDLRAAFEAARGPVLAVARDSASLIAMPTADAAAVVDQMRAIDSPFATATGKLEVLRRAVEKQSLTYEADSRAYAVESMGLVAAVILICLVGLVLGALWLLRHFAQRIDQLVAETELFSAGDCDLTRRLPAMGGAFGKICASLNGFIGQLYDLVTHVAANAGEIATAARQISAGNNDLSARTEQQASTLEETASNMEEFTLSVKQNADNTRQASELASSASTAAQQGGKVVTQAVAKITAANESSRKIGAIISTIDSIAFQTNILALNAAVEAARAGEQGRGFAVVAAEVRALAQRSAASAKEIKSLVGTAIEQVDEGATLVNEAGSSMQNIIVAIEQASGLMNDVAMASSEQAAGIEQVNRAIMQMEDVTQQNAALVEQAVAAAETMREHAEGLSVQISRFKLDDRKTGDQKPRGTSVSTVRKLAIAIK